MLNKKNGKIRKHNCIIINGYDHFIHNTIQLRNESTFLNLYTKNMFQRIKNFFYQKKIDKAVEKAVKETKQEISMQPPFNMKRCPRCWIVKLKTDFYKNRTKHDGLQSECKDCRAEISKKKVTEHQFISYRKEFYWWYLSVSSNSIKYERNWVEYIIIDRIRFNNLCEKFWKEMVRDKITHMIRWQNKNNAWKQDEDLFYRLKNWCVKQQIQDNEKKWLFS